MGSIFIQYWNWGTASESFLLPDGETLIILHYQIRLRCLWNEKNQDAYDVNPFRYCREYYELEITTTTGNNISGCWCSFLSCRLLAPEIMIADITLTAAQTAAIIGVAGLGVGLILPLQTPGDYNIIYDVAELNSVMIIDTLSQRILDDSRRARK